MSIRIKEVIQLDQLRDLVSLTNKSGYSNEVTAVGILDHEIIERSYHLFKRGELIIATFSVARTDTDLVFEAIKGIIQAGASGLLIKTIYYQTLPESIITYANQNNFPIFTFQDIFIEDILATINGALKTDIIHEIYEVKLESILQGQLNVHLQRQLLNEINPNLAPYGQIIYIKPCNHDPNQLISYLKRFTGLTKSYPGVSLIKLRSGLLFIGTQEDGLPVTQLFQSLMALIHLNLEDYYLGQSQVFSNLDQITSYIHQALTAYTVAELENRSWVTYDSIGLYKVLVPLLKEDYAQTYARDLLTPIINYDQVHQTALYPTLKLYFQVGCDSKVTAEKLFQHKNTVLYRINKAKDLMGPFTDDLDFKTQVDLAIKLREANHLLNPSAGPM